MVLVRLTATNEGTAEEAAAAAAAPTASFSTIAWKDCRISSDYLETHAASSKMQRGKARKGAVS
jgi:hypothetical protein